MNRSSGYLRRVKLASSVRLFSAATTGGASGVGGGINKLRKASSLAVAVEKNESLNLLNVAVPPKETWRTIATLRDDELVGTRPEHWYTGKAPMNCPGIDPVTRSLHSVPFLNLGTATKQSVRDYFDNTWTLTEVLYSALQGKDAFFTPPPHGLRHPLIFYYGHPAVLYVNKLRLAGLITTPVNAYYETLFETGVDEMSWDDMSKNHMTWPSVSEVHQYRKEVYNMIIDVIESTPEEDFKTINKSSKLWALVMGFEHERIHIETSSVLIREFNKLSYLAFPSYLPSYHVDSIPKEPVRRPDLGEHYPVNELIPVKGGSVTLGRDSEAVKKMADARTYGWDNEFGSRTYNVKSFKASKYLVTNGEYYEFVTDGGYANPKYWTELGWKWRAYNNAKCPTFWKLDGPQGLHHYKLRAIFNEINMPFDWPVNVNYHEAKAFCTWKSLKEDKLFRLTTELEHAMLQENEVDHVVNLKSSSTMFRQKGVNSNLSYTSECPVTASQASPQGFHDVYGNAWQWMEDSFSALDGFAIHPYYEDFSTPCFDGLHNVIKGGSFISSGNEASIHARFHFRPHFFQHAGFRYVEHGDSDYLTSCTDAPGPWVGNYPFRESATSKKLKNENKALKHLNATIAAQFGYCPPRVSSSVTSRGTIESNLLSLIKKHVPSGGRGALEVGCKAGALSFLLSKDFKKVQSIDAEAPHIEAAKKIQSTKQVEYDVVVGGRTMEKVKVDVPNKDSVSAVDFRQADSSCLPAEYKDFDVVVLNNVVDKIPAPNSLLGRLDGERGLVRKGGHVVVVHANDWSESITPSSLWIEGTAGLSDRLSKSFEAVEHTELSSVVATSDRSFQGTVFDVSVFRRKD